MHMLRLPPTKHYQGVLHEVQSFNDWRHLYEVYWPRSQNKATYNMSLKLSVCCRCRSNDADIQLAFASLSAPDRRFLEAKQRVPLEKFLTEATNAFDPSKQQHVLRRIDESEL